MKSTYMKIRQAIIEYNKKNPRLPIELSIGWAFSTKSIGLMKKVFKAADQMMYSEKFNKRVVKKRRG